ncbi:MAG: hypothetical protein K2X27_00760 [Candidatus Obscuribacterales bacterium]|nr:hypothetical protein [Candidatus Obscuribacterales bacterium]
MTAKDLFVFFAISVVAASVWTPPALSAAEEKKAPLSMDEIKERRRAIREEMMLPSLNGLRSLSYRVTGYSDYSPLEKKLGTKLQELKINIEPLLKMNADHKTCDAILQISFNRLASSTIAELKVTEWVSLMRNPKIMIQAVTYSNKVFLAGNKPEEAIDELANQFVIDFLKANQKDFDAEKHAKEFSKVTDSANKRKK